MVKDYGFKVSPELEKAAFGKVKIADLAVGELVAVIQPSAREVADKPRPPGEKVSLIGALGEIRTPDPRNRNPMLYPAELRARARGRLSDLAGQGQRLS